MKRTFPIAPLSSATHTRMSILFVFIVGLCMSPILFAPGPVKILILVIDTVALSGLFRLILRMDRVAFTVDHDALEIHGDISNRRMDRSALLIGAARRLPRAEYQSEMRPVLKMNGVGAPGYLSGWFRLRNGQKAFIYVTDAEKIVLVPTVDDYVVMLTPDDPDGLLQAIMGG